MFRVSNKWGNKTNLCFEENLVYCGWNIGLSKNDKQDILKDNPWASKMAIKFTDIQKDDIIIMPVSGGIAIGKAIEKEFRDDLEWKDTFKVKWLTKYYSRKDLSSKLQSSLKYRGTFLNLWRYSKELARLIDGGFTDLAENYSQARQEHQDKTIEKIAKHINSNSKLNFQDREFEDFIMHLFELHYIGLTGQKNNQNQEAKDGKDLTMSIDYDDFDINVSFNIQVKQHENETNSNVLAQISKSDDNDPFTKNVIVTTGKFSEDIKTKAKEKNIILFGSYELASMIFENFSSIEEFYQAKLNLYTSIIPKS
jgi:predicted Mrr-cat superfamily restriction endonuclease